MASYLDYLFPAQSAQAIPGLLSEEDALKNRQAAQTAGLLNMGLGMIAASAPSRMPQGVLQPIATGIMAGQQAYQGSFDRQLQDRLNAQKLAKEAAYNKAIEQSFVKRPTGTGLLQKGAGSQAEMLSRPEFGGGFADESTVSSLLSNPNLPQESVMDQGKFMNALAQYNPLEFAKIQAMTQKTEAGPAKIREFKALMEMPEAERNAYIKLQQILNPAQNTVVSLAEKGIDKIQGERYGEFSSAAASARRFAQDADTVNQLLKGKGGGAMVQVGTALAKDLGLKNDSVAYNDLANSIAIRGATTMRAPGSGSTSDLEFGAFKSAFPSLANSEAGREFMAQGSKEFAKRAAKLADHAAKLYRNNQYSEEAIAAYDTSLGPVIDVKKLDSFIKKETSPSGQRRDFR